MRLYRVEWYSEEESSQGFSWFTSRAAADKEVKAANADPSQIDAIDFSTTKAGIMDLLRRVACHPDNG